MEYTIKQFAQIANISTRTLRYYDEIGLLKPSKINSSGYRVYGQNQVDLLQQILFFRELGFKLTDIKKIITAKDFNLLNALENHLDELIKEQTRITTLIDTLNKTINEKKGGETMKDSEKFAGFKKALLDENEKKYGKEIREKYGEETVQKSNQKFMKMTEAEYQKLKALEEELYATLKQALETNDPTHPLAQRVAKLHQEWLSFYWTEYHKEAHEALVKMYVEDERFAAYYEKIAPGATAFLRDAVIYYLNK